MFIGLDWIKRTGLCGNRSTKSLDEGFSSGSKYFSSANRYSASFGIEDGSWFARSSPYDVFGQDELVWSPTIGFKPEHEGSIQINEDVIDSLLTVIRLLALEKQIVDELGSRWQLQVSNNGNVTGIALAADEKNISVYRNGGSFSVISMDSANHQTGFIRLVQGKTYINSTVIASSSINELWSITFPFHERKFRMPQSTTRRLPMPQIRSAYLI